MLGLIILFSLIGGVFSLLGGIFLLAKKNLSKDSMITLISFAAGVLLSVSFSDLLPEAIELSQYQNIDARTIFSITLLAMAGFFLFERWFFWFHHHHGPHDHQPEPTVLLVWIGDTIHNFLDGVVITASFLANAYLGIITSLAVAAHEVPQEIAEFSLFLSKGVGKKKVLILNTISAFATTIGALFAFFFWKTISSYQPHLLSFTAGMFIYIAGSDLIPELHLAYKSKRAFLQTLSFLLGIFITYVLKILLHSLVV